MIDLELLIGTIYYEVVIMTDGTEKVIYSLPYIVMSVLLIITVWWMMKYVSQLIAIVGGGRRNG